VLYRARVGLRKFATHYTEPHHWLWLMTAALLAPFTESTYRSRIPFSCPIRFLSSLVIAGQRKPALSLHLAVNVSYCAL